jgi:diguanylate cyclase (GGDEF)-like protein/PAS domain S-box-containing protein
VVLGGLRKTIVSRAVAAGLVVALVGIVTSIALARWSSVSLARTRDERLASTSLAVAHDAGTSVRQLGSVAAAAAFHLSSSGTPSRPELVRYAERLLASVDTPVTSLTYVARVPAAQISTFEAQQRMLGSPDFAVQGTSRRDLLYVAVATSSGPSPSDGFDLGGDPRRVTAFERAAETGEPALAASTAVVEDALIPVHQRPPGVAVYAAIYRPGMPLGSADERRAAVVGWVAVGVRAPDLLAAAGDPTDGRDVHVEILDGPTSTATALLELGDASSGRGAASVRLEILGRTWTVNVTPAARFTSTADDLQPWLVAAVGLAATLVASGAVVRASRSGVRWRSEAAAAAADKARTDAWSQQILSVLSEGVVVHDADGQIVEANAAAAAVFGLELAHLVGDRPTPDGWRLVSEDGTPLAREDQPASVALRTGEAVSGAIIGAELPDGERRWVRIGARPIALDGMPAGVLATMVDVTEERASLARLLAAARSAPIGMALITPDQRFRAVNPALAELLGRSEDELTSMTTLDLLHPDDTPGASRWHEVAEGRLDSYQAERCWRHADGSPVWVSVSIGAVRDADGRLLECVCHVEDISERLDAESVRSGTELRQRTTLEALADGVVLYDVTSAGDLVETLTNPAALALLAAEAGSESLPRVDRFFAERAFASGDDIDGALVSIDGSDAATRWLSVTTRALRDAARAITAIVVSIDDVTAQRSAEEAVHAAYSRFAALLEHGSDLITIYDADGLLTYASPAHRRMLGVDPAERIGTSMLNSVHPDDRPIAARALDGLLATPGATTTVELRLAHADGAWRHAEVTVINRLHDPAVGGIVANTRDVTDRVEAARVLEHQATHDALTGLANRAVVLDRLTEALAAADRTGRHVAVLFADLDGFKEVNDSLGHAAGDQLLTTVARRLQATVRDGDTVARLGGDEFVVVAGDLPSAAAGHDLARRVRYAVAQPTEIDGHLVMTRISVGVAAADGRPADDLLRSADAALYAIKRSRGPAVPQGRSTRQVRAGVPAERTSPGRVDAGSS